MWYLPLSWRRKWQPTPVFLPGESHGQRSLGTVHGVAKSWTRLSDYHSLPPSQLVSILILRTYPPGDLIQFYDFSHHHADVDGFQTDTKPAQTFLSPMPYGSLLISTSKSHNLINSLYIVNIKMSLLYSPPTKLTPATKSHKPET